MYRKSSDTIPTPYASPPPHPPFIHHVFLDREVVPHPEEEGIFNGVFDDHHPPGEQQRAILAVTPSNPTLPQY